MSSSKICVVKVKIKMMSIVCIYICICKQTRDPIFYIKGVTEASNPPPYFLIDDLNVNVKFSNCNQLGNAEQGRRWKSKTIITHTAVNGPSGFKLKTLNFFFRIY